MDLQSTNAPQMPATLTTLAIRGYRGFGQSCELRPAQPNGKDGSGLTALVGPNNAGKTSVVEVFQMLARPGGLVTFAAGQRNIRAGGQVTCAATWSDSQRVGLSTVEAGGSTTQWDWPGYGHPAHPIFVLPSYRAFATTFRWMPAIDRKRYFPSTGVSNRGLGGRMASFPGRLAAMQEQKQLITSLLAQVVDPVPDWYVDREGTDYVLRLRFEGAEHTSEGAGEGILNLLAIIDSLYDSVQGEVIVIDEPELSLHPAYQKKLLALLASYAKDRQIIYTTHSPYLINWSYLFNGGTVVRVYKDGSDTAFGSMQPQTVRRIESAYGNRFNPHVFGLDAREIFFQEDGVILVEGQDDVVHYPLIAQQLDVTISDNFYGWGVGGANSMELITQLLSELGFRQVFGILDGDKLDVATKLNHRYPQFKFLTIPAADVRDKEARNSTEAVAGLIDHNGQLKQQYQQDLQAIFADIASYFRAHSGQM